MTMVASGVISISGNNVYRSQNPDPDPKANESVSVEAKLVPPEATLDANDSMISRTLAEKPVLGTPLSWSDWYGKSLNPYEDVRDNPFIGNGGTNRWTIQGINAGGNGPPGSPGNYSCPGEGTNTYLCYWISSTHWRSGSGGEYTISNDMVLTGAAPTLTEADCVYLGIDVNNVRSISAPITFRLVFDIDHALRVGYYTVTLSDPPRCSDMTSGTFTQQGYWFESGGGRQRGLTGTFTFPPPADNQIRFIACSDRDGGCGGGPHGWNSMTITIV